MASQELKHRKREEEEQQHQPKDIDANMNSVSAARSRQKKRTVMAKRGLRSLCLALAVPVSLTILDIFFFGSSLHYATMKKPFWLPPLWALHLACLGSAFLMGLSAWLVWADGGFHKHPLAFLLYLSQLALGLAWDPIVFRAGATKIGLLMCVALFGALVGCVRLFRSVNPIAGDVVKPCLFWALLLSVVNLKLVYQ